MHILYLSPQLLDVVVDNLDTQDVKNFVLTCRSLCHILRHHLWEHIHVKTISSKSNYTNTDLSPFKGKSHEVNCNKGELFMFEHSCKKRYIRIDEHNLSEICIGMLHGWYQDAFSRVKTLTFDLPMLFPEPNSLPVTAKQMNSVDFGSLVHWFVRNLNPEVFIDLHRVEVTAVELMVELESPIVSTLLEKFDLTGVETAVFAVLQENWIVRRPIRKLVTDHIRLLSIECGTFDDAYALADGGPLPDGISRLELRVESGYYEADQLRQFLSQSNFLTQLKICGDVINPNGIKWTPACVETLQVQENRPKLLPVGKPLFTPALRHLHVNLKSGSILEQFQLPYLSSLWISLSYCPFYDYHFETISSLLKSSPRLKQLRVQGIPYDQIARLLSVGGCDGIEALTVEYAGFTKGNEQFTNRLIRKGAERIVRETPKLRTLNIDLLLPKAKRLIGVLQEFVEFCPHLQQILCCCRKEHYQLPWLSEYTHSAVWDGFSMVDLVDGTCTSNKPWAVVDIPQFKDEFMREEPEEANIAADSNVTAALMFLSVNS